MEKRRLIQTPRLWAAELWQKRRVTWMECFFDLIFVAAVSQVGAPLNKNYSSADLGRYTFLFVLIWLAWSGHTLYVTRFDTEDPVQRIFVLVQSFLAAVMAANAKDSLASESSAGFGVAFAGMRVILAVQYLRARSIPGTRTLTTRYAAGYMVSALFWIASGVAPIPLRYVLWAIALAIDLATPWLAVEHSLRFPPDASHYPERFGLFTIILLGEFVAQTMLGIESQETWSLAAATTAFCSMAFAFVVWWWYFDGAKSAEHRYVRNKREAVRFYIWQYAHLPLFIALGIGGVGFHHAISVMPGDPMSVGEEPILAGGVALLMAALIVIGVTSQASLRTVIIQSASVALVVGANVFLARLPAVFVVMILLLCLLIPAIEAQRKRLSSKVKAEQAKTATARANNSP